MVSRSLHDPRIAVVIPCYKVLPHIREVLNNVGAEVWRIYVVDDCCPDRSGDFVTKSCTDMFCTKSAIHSAIRIKKLRTSRMLDLSLC